MKTFTPTKWELEHGYFENGDFYRPACCVMRNGDFIEVMGIVNSYPHSVACEIKHHLEAISDNEFTIGIFSYIPVAYERIEINEDLTNFIDDPFLLQAITKAVQA